MNQACADCKRPTPKTRCPDCERHRSRTRRPPDRYGAPYPANRRILLATSDVCWRCGLHGADTADHVVPLAHGGTHDLSNLLPAHGRCNSAAGATVRR